jgi:hypothetical protein
MSETMKRGGKRLLNKKVKLAGIKTVSKERKTQTYSLKKVSSSEK